MAKQAREVHERFKLTRLKDVSEVWTDWQDTKRGHSSKRALKNKMSFVETRQRHDGPNTTWRSKPRMASTREAKVHIPGLGTCLYVRLLEDSPSVFSDDCATNSLSHGSQEKPNTFRRPTCCTDNFVPFFAVTRQKVNPPTRRKPVPVEEPCKP